MRLRTLLALEVRVQWRHRVVAALAGLAAVWGGLLLALPASPARALAPWLLLLETALAGTTLVGALLLMERDTGVRAAYAVTPVPPGQRLAVRIGTVTLLVLAGAVPVALAGRPAGPAGLVAALLGVGLAALLCTLVAAAVAARCRSVVSFMVALPLALLPLLLPPLGHGAGLRHPLLHAVPTTGAGELIRAGYAPAGALTTAGAALRVGWLVAACLAAAVLAGRRLRGPDRVPTGRPARPPRCRLPGLPERPGPVWSFLGTDLRSVRRDPLLVLIGLSPLLLGAGLRLGYPPVAGWLAGHHGIDLAGYRPVLLAGAVLLHVPVGFGMIAALLVLDDVDDRALTALRTSPLSLPRYLGYRAGVATVAAWAGLAVAIPLSGLAPGTGWQRLLPAGLLAGPVAALFLLATLALARSKVEGVAAVKLLGLPSYAPVVAWWLPPAAGWAFAALPTWWVLRALWTSWPYAAAGAVLMAGAVALLAQRVLHRLGEA